jgi:hypothetical protein
MKLLSPMTTDTEDIVIHGFRELEKPLTKGAAKLYEGVEIDTGDSKHESAERTLITGWHESALSLHGIERVFSGAGRKTVIPGRVIGT